MHIYWYRVQFRLVRCWFRFVFTCFLNSLKCHIMLFGWMTQTVRSSVFYRIFVFNFPFVCFFRLQLIVWAGNRFLLKYWRIELIFFCFSLVIASGNIQNKHIYYDTRNKKKIQSRNEWECEGESDESNKKKIGWILFIFIRQCWACVHCLDACIRLM